MAKEKPKKNVAAISHAEDKRKIIPTAEYQSVVDDDTKNPKPYKYRRNTDLDPQLIWRGKDEQDWSDLVVYAPPLYIQEKVHPKALIDDLLRRSEAGRKADDKQIDLFADFNGIPEGVDKTEFYRHDQNWSNRMILGDSLQVMASLAEREGLKSKVQCIYFDPPYGIKFNSNLQWSTTNTTVKDGNIDHITREPEQVKAFRDTWRDGIHSYLTYLRDRLTVAQELLTDSGSIFVQIGDENVHRVRSVLDEIFGEENFEAMISYSSTSGLGGDELNKATNYILWFSKNHEQRKYRALFKNKEFGGEGSSAYKKIELEDGQRFSISDFEERNNIIFSYNTNCMQTKHCRVYALGDITSANHGQGVGKNGFASFYFQGEEYKPGKGIFKTHEAGMQRLAKSARIGTTKNNIGYH